jgi:pimeloyl-ACP methyl ester carboxylesterase
VTATIGTREEQLGGVRLELLERGSGDVILLLHGHDGIVGLQEAFFERLAARYHVIEPVHPGFGSTDVPEWMDSIDDLAYLYLSLLERLDVRINLVGLSMGGWIAAELATKCYHRLSRLVLVDPVGIQVGERDVRDIPDIFAITPQERAALTYADITKAPDPARMSDEELGRQVRDDQAAALFLWQPYMSNPKLRRRLAAIKVPTLIVRGESDGIVSRQYAQAYCDAIPGAQLRTIHQAGHLPQREQPQELAEAIEAFLVR